jgi:radical SAM superfamily enzyme YgiQ (UPF0313 family)
MKILLIYPKGKQLGGALREECCSGAVKKPVLPSQILLCTAYLRKKGWDADFIDQQIDDRKFDFDKYDVVIIWSIIWDNMYEELQLLKDAKLHEKKTILVYNGPAHIEDEVLEEFEFVDACIRLYEREITIDKLLTAWKNNEKIDFPGVVYRSKNKVINTGIAPPMDSCEHLESAAEILSELKLEKYKGMVFVTSSRGCPYPCSFCQFASIKLRHRPIKDIVEEMSIISEYTNSRIYLLDLDILIDRKWGMQLCEKISHENINQWFTDTRANSASKESLSKMKKSGCNDLVIGIESATPTILMKIKKGINLETIIKSADNCHAVNIVPRFTLIIGFPWDTHETLGNYPKLMKKLLPAIFGLQFLAPLKGTLIYEQMKELGFFDELHLKDYILIEKPIKKPLYPTLYLSKNDLIKAYNKLKHDFHIYDFPGAYNNMYAMGTAFLSKKITASYIYQYMRSGIYFPNL